jgi:tRNA modification GTPase
MLNSSLLDTIVAPATAPGTSAIGVVRLSGQRAIEIADSLMPGKDLTAQDSHTLHYGKLVGNGAVIDEVVVSLFRAPRSYTKEDIVEISCHGSPYIIQKVLETAISAGARMARPGEFTMRAFLNGRFDLTQAEAVADLIASENESQHNLALRQMRGGFSHEISRLRQELIDFTALIELELDFGEEDVEFANRERLLLLVNNIQAMIKSLLDTFRLGNAIRQGVSTVLVGRPNAGKSTLLNALLNEERAIVSPIAGTTRDTVEEVLHINGVGFRLVDTAGIREAKDEIESIGIRRTMEKVEQSAILIYIFDSTDLGEEEVNQDIHMLQRPDIPLIVAVNKIDAGAHTLQSWQQKLSLLKGVQVLFLSAKAGTGISDLKELLFNLAVGSAGGNSNVVVANARHYEALYQAGEALNSVAEAIQQGLTGELLAHDLRLALHYLGEITGEVSTEDILESVFSRFCIGK